MSAEAFVTVRIPSAVYRGLHPLAMTRGIEVGDLLVELSVTRATREHLVNQGDLPMGTPGRAPALYRQMTPARLAKLRELHAEGYSNGQIAEVIGTSRSSVQVYVNRIKRGEL